MDDSDKYSETETDARREAGLKKLLATPPKPHKGNKKSAEPKPNAPLLKQQKKGQDR